MKANRLVVIFALLGVVTFPLPATEVPLRLSDAEQSYELELLRVNEKRGGEALAARLKADLTKNPQPWVKAWYANYAIYGKRVGVESLMDVATGCRLAQEAMQEGCVFAYNLMGRAMIDGLVPGQPKNTAEGARLVLLAANAGHSTSMATASYCYFFGVGVPQDRALAEAWARRGAGQNATDGLWLLGRYFEEGVYVKPADPAKACEYYFEAALHGHGLARQRIEQLASKNFQPALKYPHLWRLHHAVLGAELTNARMRESIEWLEQNCADDPQALVTVAEVRLERDWHTYDPKKALAGVERAIALGSDDARCLKAKMRLFGLGVKKDPAAALQELRALAERNHPRALGQLGWAYYWGPWKELGLSQDSRLAWEYSKRAAELGDWFAQKNTGFCYEHGIGVETNYRLAAWYYGLAATRGSIEAKERERRLLAFIKD